jgi:hypothetical protein
MAISPKAIYMYIVVSIKIPMTIIIRIEKINPKAHLEAQKTTNSQGNIEQKEQLWR